MYNVLIADDEPLIRKGLHYSINWNEMGFDVIGEAANVKTAQQMIQDNLIHVIITDISMPGESGLDLLQWVTEHYPKIKKVVISGYNNFDYAVSALKYQTQDYILKPIKKENIIACMLKIKEILDKEENINDKSLKIKQVTKEFFLHKLLYHTFVSTEEFNEICNQLEIETKKVHYIVAIIPIQKEWKSAILNLIAKYAFLETEKYIFCISPECEIEEIQNKLDSLLSTKLSKDKKYILGSVQTADNIGISFQKALSKLTEENKQQTNIFSSSFHTEHELLKEIIDNIEIGAKQQVAELIHTKFITFTDVAVAKSWCVWVIDQLEEYFSNYKLLGHYLQAIKNYEHNPNIENEVEVFEKMFMDYISKVFMTLKESSNITAKQLTESVKNITEREYSNQKFSLTVLANMLDISYGYLSTQIKLLTGKSYTEYLLSIRMAKASELIMSNQYKLYEISYKVGYGSARYFAETFKKYYHVSPKEYRNMKLGLNDDKKKAQE